MATTGKQYANLVTLAHCRWVASGKPGTLAQLSMCDTLPLSFMVLPNQLGGLSIGPNIQQANVLLLQLTATATTGTAGNAVSARQLV